MVREVLLVTNLALLSMKNSGAWLERPSSQLANFIQRIRDDYAGLAWGCIIVLP